MKCIYCVIDVNNEMKKPTFFVNKRDVINYFCDKYVVQTIKWIKMDNARRRKYGGLLF